MTAHGEPGGARAVGPAAAAAVAVHHRLEGPEGARVIAFANSLGTTLEIWDEQAAALASNFRVLRFDQRGHGRSPVPPGRCSIEDLGADLLALLDRRGFERVSLCGLSLGGMVAMWIASEAPERIDRLALCCTAACFDPPEQWKQRAATVRAEGLGAIVDSVLERWLTPAIDQERPGTRERVAAILRSVPAEGYAASCEALAGLDLGPRLAAIRAPTLVIAGDRDPASPPDRGRAIAAAIPGARLHVLERARHLANLERPEPFNRALAAHLGSQTGAAQEHA